MREHEGREWTDKVAVKYDNARGTAACAECGTVIRTPYGVVAGHICSAPLEAPSVTPGPDNLLPAPTVADLWDEIERAMRSEFTRADDDKKGA